MYVSKNPEGHGKGGCEEVKISTKIQFEISTRGERRMGAGGPVVHVALLLLSLPR